MSFRSLRSLRGVRGFRPVMPVMRVMRVTAFAAVAMLLTTSTLAQVRATKRDALTMKQKVAAIAAHGERPTTQGRRTTVTESEVNSYLTYELGTDLPIGVVQPSVSVLGTGRITGRAVVDLDAVRKAGGNSIG